MKRAWAVLFVGAVLTVLTLGVAPAFATGDGHCDHYECPTTTHTHDTTTVPETTVPETTTSVEPSTTIRTTTTEAATTSVATTTTKPTTPELPRTGSSQLPLAAFGAMLVAVGLALRSRTT